MDRSLAVEAVLFLRNCCTDEIVWMTFCPFCVKYNPFGLQCTKFGFQYT
jgi:hypothetical protein